MEPKLEIRHLKLLAAVAESGSVTQASKQLHLTQSALSHQLRDAEDKLGTELFLRLGKKMALTPAGETLLASTRRVLEDLGNAEQQIEGGKGGTRGVIRLSTECYTCYHWLPPVLDQFHQKFADVEININANATPSATAALLDGKLDVAISHCPPQDKKLRVMPMFDDELVLVMARRHRLAALPRVRPADLAGETVLIYPPREESTLLSAMRRARTQPKQVIEIPLTEAMVELASAGAGVGLLASWAVSPQVRAKKVTTKSVGAGLSRSWYALTLRSRAMTPYLQAFLELLKSSSPFTGKAG
jgi:LysR family transcriptional regulator for metE and metH